LLRGEAIVDVVLDLIKRLAAFHEAICSGRLFQDSELCTFFNGIPSYTEAVVAKTRLHHSVNWALHLVYETIYLQFLPTRTGIAEFDLSQWRPTILVHETLRSTTKVDIEESIMTRSKMQRRTRTSLSIPTIPVLNPRRDVR
jgi:hypothetical protein